LKRQNEQLDILSRAVGPFEKRQLVMNSDAAQVIEHMAREL
jgi:hypothetical protein